MDIQELNFLKDWREKRGISQKRFAELAGVSLTTLRQFEFGTHAPQSKTLKKLTEIIHAIDSGSLSAHEIKPAKKRGRVKASQIVSPVALATDSAMAAPKRRGRPPKSLSQNVAVPVVNAPAKVEPVVLVDSTPKPPLSSPPPTVSPVPFVGAGVIQLSNLDLELINRVLNMTGKEKLDLLAKLL